MTKAAAIDLAPRRIRVNSVHPGPIDTDMIKIRGEEQNRLRVQQVPMKRMGSAEEVAKLVLWLLSDESGYVTGAEISIDGGVSLWGALGAQRRNAPPAIQNGAIRGCAAIAPYPRRITGAAMLSIITLMQAGLPQLSARSMAPGRSAARSTSSPCPPSAAATRS